MTYLGLRCSIITTTDFAPCSKQLWKGVCCSRCTKNSCVPPEAHTSYSSWHSSQTVQLVVTSPLTPPKHPLHSWGVQLSLPEARRSGSLASPWCPTSCPWQSIISMPFKLSWSPWLLLLTVSLRPSAQLWEMKRKLLSAEAGFCTCILDDNLMQTLKGCSSGNNSWIQMGSGVCCVPLTHIVLVNLLKPPHPVSIGWDRISVDLQINSPFLA